MDERCRGDRSDCTAVGMCPMARRVGVRGFHGHRGRDRPDRHPCAASRPRIGWGGHGGIGFVGLVIPHLMRSFIGHGHRRLVVSSAMAGAIFLMWADTFSRTVFSPAELPIGVITGLLGAPFLLVLVRREAMA